jgi:hypothetical protein
MLRVWIVIAIEVWGIGALMCLVMALGIRTQPIPAFISGISLCEGIPCYLNILPGKTGWQEAQSMLATFPEIRKFGVSNYSNLPDFYGTLMVIPNQDNLTQELALSPPNNLTSIGSAVLQFGAPCVAVRLGRDDIGLIYPGIAVVTRMGKFGSYFVLRPTSPVKNVILSTQVGACSDIALDRTQGDFRWHGFVRYAENGG